MACYNPASTRRPRSPDVRAVDGQVSIKFQVHEGADFRWLLSQLMELLGDQGSSSAAVQAGRAELQVQVFEKQRDLLSSRKARRFVDA